MKVAQKRDAVLQGMFYFRKDICKGITFSWVSRVTLAMTSHQSSCALSSGRWQRRGGRLRQVPEQRGAGGGGVHPDEHRHHR